MQRPLGQRVCRGVGGFLRKYSLISQAIVEEPQGNHRLPEDSCPLGSCRIFLLVLDYSNSFIEIEFIDCTNLDRIHILYIYCTHLKCTIQWLLVYSQNCASITAIHFRTFSLSQKETTNPLAFTCSQTPTGNHSSTSCPHRVACSGHFI